LTELIAGVDEVGRGSLAGPVIAAAVILKNKIEGLDDSKKLSKTKREQLNQKIIENSFFAYGSASVEEIDDINILQASLLAMKRAILNLPIRPNKVLVDGTHKPKIDILVETIIGGDSLIAEISAASIIAKVYRDDLMMKQDVFYPNYGFGQHKGYGTQVHIENIRTHGSCLIHRKSFKGTS
tara:strand:+ start:3279 stop:3824 length:546 start_codon:yes stop_codon:yes gene_type:complete